MTARLLSVSELTPAKKIPKVAVGLTILGGEEDC